MRNPFPVRSPPDRHLSTPMRNPLPVRPHLAGTNPQPVPVRPLPSRHPPAPMRNPLPVRPTPGRYLSAPMRNLFSPLAIPTALQNRRLADTEKLR